MSSPPTTTSDPKIPEPAPPPAYTPPLDTRIQTHTSTHIEPSYSRTGMMQEPYQFRTSGRDAEAIRTGETDIERPLSPREVENGVHVQVEKKRGSGMAVGFCAGCVVM